MLSTREVAVLIIARHDEDIIKSQVGFKQLRIQFICTTIEHLEVFHERYR